MKPKIGIQMATSGRGASLKGLALVDLFYSIMCPELEKTVFREIVVMFLEEYNIFILHENWLERF